MKRAYCPFKDFIVSVEAWYPPLMMDMEDGDVDPGGFHFFPGVGFAMRL